MQALPPINRRRVLLSFTLWRPPAMVFVGGLSSRALLANCVGLWLALVARMNISGP